jgi:ubiquinone/menaquinone biosynthesis C-methylase UbiE
MSHPAGEPDRRRRFGRYTLGAWAYGVLSLEWPIYRAGRLVGVELLDLQPGQQVLDVGCGTGLNFAAVDAAIGPTGTIVGVDLSGHMLARAHARVRRHGWRNVCLVQANASRWDPLALFAGERFDAVLATYALSVIEDGPAAWRSALAALRPGGRAVVVDLAPPVGGWAVLGPLARLACFTGGVDLRRRPWQWVERDTGQVQQRTLRGRHIRIAAGTVATDGPTGRGHRGAGGSS